MNVEPEEGDEKSSPAANQLIDEFKILNKQVVQKYGEAKAELPYGEWAIFKTLMARTAELSLPEQRYLWRRLRYEGKAED